MTSSRQSSGLWLAWVSRRFLTGRKGGRGRLVFFFSLVLITAGVGTLNTILAVMNGLQQGYIRSILEIGSYHLRWNAGGDTLAEQLSDTDINGIASVLSSDKMSRLVVPFREGQTMLTGVRPRPAGALIRGVPENIYERDKGLASNLFMVEGEFDLSGSGIVLGRELALNLGVEAGDTVKALDLGAEGFNLVEESLEVKGVFRCGYREYESALAFVSLDSSTRILGRRPAEIGVKLRQVDRDRQYMARVLPQLADYPEPGQLQSWRETNRSFFGALRTEKTMMLLLLALIFVVVAVNIDHSLRRMATERTEDLALLKAVGASPSDVRFLFLRYGLVIGGSGGLLGSILGVLIGSHVDSIIGLFVRRSSLEAFFRSSQVMPLDVIIIFAMALLLSCLSAIRAASMAARLKPAEVLRSE
ncbi:MAG: hypothetical protein CSA76_01720 [Spirochaetales bacterium]|nr:MAG: hypothetical protein CSA76_01720 [Spirochaetales bacterium]